MRVYNRTMGGTSWASVEDSLPAGNALGYNQNWQYRHTGGELLMMGATGEPSGYYPMDSNGLPVQSELPMVCVCLVALVPMVCPPLGYGGCDENGDEECVLAPPSLPEIDYHYDAAGHQGSLHYTTSRPCNAWQRFWCKWGICRGRMLDCWQRFRCRWFSVVICLCRGRP